MAILLTKTTKVVVQGITGREGSMRAKFMRRLGTNVVAGVTPGRGGEEVDGIPVYNTVKDAVKNQGLFDVTVTFIPGTGLKDAVFEALDSDIKWAVMPVERVPLYDILEMVAYGKQKGAMLLGPGSIGINSPGIGALGWLGGSVEFSNRHFVPGHVGVISRSGGQSGTLPYVIAEGGLRCQHGYSCRNGTGDRHVLCRYSSPVPGRSRYGCDGHLRRDGRFPRGRGGAAGASRESLPNRSSFTCPAPGRRRE